MADIKKFLDSAGVGTLWAAVTAELNKKANAATTYTKTEVDTAIANAAYDDTQVKADIKANADAIGVLNGTSSQEGSVAYQIAQIVAGAGADFDTLKEIADWIAAHPTDAAGYNARITANAEAIDALEALVGDKAVATQIAEALEAAEFDQYALASDLEALATRVGTLETNYTALAATVNAHTEASAEYGTRIGNVETKAQNNETSITNLTGRLDGIVAQGGEPNVINTIKVNGVVQTITDKSVDIEVPVVQALTEAEIKAACGIA